jgi:hypothetical protein
VWSGSISSGGLQEPARFLAGPRLAPGAGEPVGLHVPGDVATAQLLGLHVRECRPQRCPDVADGPGGCGAGSGPDRPLNRILLVEGSMHSYLQQRGGSEAVDRERTLGDDSFSPSGELPSTRIG